MELKRINAIMAVAACALLIVPYGIETHPHQNPRCLLLLLIVPYGIETT